MKHFKLFFACVLLSLFSVSMWADEVTFDFNDYKGEGTTSSGSAYTMSDKADVSIGDTKFFGNNNQAHFYANGVTTITPASGVTITQIVINATAANYNGYQSSGTMTWSTGSSSASEAVVTWTGSATSAFTLTHNKQIRWTSIVVTYSKGGTPTCATPTFDPASGELFSDDIDVKIACATEGATIYYTTNGVDPTTSSNVYSTALNFTETTTLKAMAVKEGSNNSAIATATYTKMTPVPGYEIDFESDLAAYVDWNFVNLTKFNETITAHEGTYFAKTNGTNTASVTTKAKVANPGTLTYYISKIGTNTNVNSKWKARVSEDGTSWTIVGTEYAAGDGVTAGTWYECTADLSGYSNVYVQVYYDGTSAVRTIDDISLTTATPSSVETPTFSPVAGTYTSAQSVELSCATDGATIYYTTNGDTPDNTSTPYTSAISVGETMTIKAIAIKESESSAVATATYTINLPLSTMDQIFAAATAAGSTATDVNITFGSWVVSGVSTNGKNVFVTDGTKGFVVFDNGGSMGFAVGDVLSGTAACKVQLYKGAAELTLLTSTTEGLSVATGGSVTPEVKAISALGGINTGAPVTINSVQFDGEYLSDGANSIKPYNSLFAYEALENGKYYNVTGIYQQFGNTTKEILPRSAADIEELTLADPELSYSPASETIEVGDSWSAPTFNNEHGLTVSFSGDNDAVATVNTTTGEIALAGGTGTAVITASFAGNATYAAGNATYTITVNPASVSENVVILAVYDTKYYAMSTNNSSSAFTAIEVEYDGSQVTVNSAEDKAAIQWTKKTSGDNTTFQNSADKYMKSADGTSMSLQDAVCNWVWDATGEYYKIDGTTRTFFYQNGTGFKNFAVSNFNKSGYSGKAEVIVIDPANIIISSKVSAELAYDPATLTITQGDVWSAPTLGYVVGFDGLAAITYASDNEAVATVTDAGVISLAGGTGTATITATFAGNANYLAGNATYAITVNAPAATPTGTTYTKVTSTAEITDGEYLIVYEGDGATHEAMAFNGSLDNVDQALKAIAVTIVGDEIAGNTDLDAATFTIDVAAGTLQSASGYYIGRTENSNGIEKDNVNTFTNTFAITDGKAVITSAGGPTLRYNYASDQLRFRYYKSGQQDIQLYKKVVPVVTPETVRTGLTAGNYYTVCYNKKMTNITGATLWRFVGKDVNFAYIEEVSAPFPAGTPYILYAEAATVTAEVEGDATLTAGSNGAIHGTFSAMDQDALNAAATAAGHNLYLVIGNQLRQATGDALTVGNSLPANRAYVILDEITGGAPAPGKKFRSMPLQGQTPTGVENLEGSEVPVKMLINGQLFILRGEKLYDAQGRLVK